MTILSFNERVNLAINIVNQQYPSAKLYEADGKSSDGLTNDPNKIDQLKVIFQNPNDTTVVIEETSYGEFGQPQLVDAPWLEDIVIEWPIKMDLVQANQLKEKAGYQEAYSNVTLRSPLGPQKNNPSFIFGTNLTHPYIFVDTVTGKVFVSS